MNTFYISPGVVAKRWAVEKEHLDKLFECPIHDFSDFRIQKNSAGYSVASDRRAMDYIRFLQNEKSLRIMTVARFKQDFDDYTYLIERKASNRLIIVIMSQLPNYERKEKIEKLIASAKS